MKTILLIGVLFSFIATIGYTIWLCVQPESNKESNENGCVLRQPKLYKWFPLSLAIPFGCLAVWGLLFQIQDFGVIVFIYLPMVSILLLISICFSLWKVISICFSLWKVISICFSLWKVEVRKEEFLYRNYLGVTKIYQYKDVSYAFNGKKYAYILNGKTVFTMPGWIENRSVLTRAYKKYTLKNRT